jgi:hypothetical protein
MLPPMICTVFEDDIQGSIRGCLDLMTAIERVSLNPDIQHADTGNAHSILISKDGVTITNLWDDTMLPYHISLKEAFDLFLTWLCLFHQHRRDKEARRQSLEG